ncbi:MAG: hypothetical protein L6R35_007554, partial [Caloplaca aegaea]
FGEIDGIANEEVDELLGVRSDQGEEPPVDLDHPDSPEPEEFDNGSVPIDHGAAQSPPSATLPAPLATPNAQFKDTPPPNDTNGPSLPQDGLSAAINHMESPKVHAEETVEAKKRASNQLKDTATPLREFKPDQMAKKGH